MSNQVVILGQVFFDYNIYHVLGRSRIAVNFNEVNKKIYSEEFKNICTVNTSAFATSFPA